MPRSVILVVLCATLLSGCWSGPDRAELLVGTTPPGASCILTRLGQPIGSVASTPAIALVEPSADDIDISCSRPGFADAAVTLPAPEGGLDVGAVFFRPETRYRRRVDIALVPR
jgi:hypothetical protein